MKELLRSYNIFSAQLLTRQILKSIPVFVGMSVVFTLLEFMLEGTVDFMGGFWYGMIMVFAPMFGSILLNNLYSYNQPINPGYRYFHSISESALHFKRAIIASNIFSLCITAVFAVISFVVDTFIMGENITLVICISVGLAMPGCINLLGYVKNTLLRLLVVMPICCLGGFFFGFSSGEDDSVTVNPIVSVIIIAVCAALYIAGFIYSVRVSEKKWGEAE